MAIGLAGTALVGCGSDSDDRQVLELKKTGSPYAAPLGTFMYHLCATNPGPDPVSNVQVVDQLPPEVATQVFLVEFTVPWECVTDTAALQVTCTIDSLAPGSADFDIGGFFTDALSPGQEILNQASVSADGAVSAEAAWTGIVLAETTLSVAKSAPQRAAPGELVSYELSLTNTGETLALDPRIQEHLPNGVFPRGLTAPPDWQCGFVPVGPVKYQCEGPILEPGGTAEISLSIQIPEDASPGTVLTNRIVGRAQNAIPVEASASTEVISSE